MALIGFFFFKQKTAYELRISDWSSDVCSSELTSVKDLDGGVRLRRAANANGTSWQEVRWDLSILDTWSWGFPGGMLLDSTTVAGTRYDGGNTRDSMQVRAGQRTSTLRTQNNERRVNTVLTSNHGWQGGFAYGSTVSNGSSSSTSYLWERSEEHTSELQSIMRISYA